MLILVDCVRLTCSESLTGLVYCTDEIKQAIVRGCRVAYRTVYFTDKVKIQEVYVGKNKTITSVEVFK